MENLLGRISGAFSALIWESDLTRASPAKIWLIRVLRVAGALHREFSRGELTLRAMGLVYTTLLSLVPLLAVSFSVLKAFDVHNQIEPVLANFMAPLGDKGVEITANIIGFVENMRVGVLGSLGLAVLIFTVVSLVQKIENAFNSIWHDTPTRSVLRRFSDYLSVMLVGPVLVFSAIGLTASMVSNRLVQKILAIEPFGTAFYLAGQVMPYLLIIAAFTFVYIFIPNTKVRLSSALTGGVIAGILWKTAGWGFAVFVAHSANYHAIYSGFAIVIIFMIWIYVSWLILLLGAQISFYHQNPQFLRQRVETPRLSAHVQEYLAYWLMRKIGTAFSRGETPPRLSELAQRAQVPTDLLNEVEGALKREQLIRETADEPPGLVPGRDLDTLTLAMIRRAIRTAHEETFTIDERALGDAALESIMQEVDAAADSALHERTLASIVESSTPSDVRGGA